MLKMIFWGLMVYALYRFIFGIVIPVTKTTKAVKQQMEAMQRQAQQHAQAQGYQQPKSAPSTPPNAPTEKGDYIDFEEVK
jgi:hypothetical protein